MVSENHPVWIGPPEKILEQFRVDPLRGLSEREANERLEKYGPNKTMPDPESTPFSTVASSTSKKLLLYTLADLGLFLIFLLPTIFTTGVLSIAGDNGLSMILFLVCTFSVVKAFQIFLFRKNLVTIKEWYNQQQAQDSTLGSAGSKILVLRDGNEIQIPAPNVVPGDILILEPGEENIPADARLIESTDLHVSEVYLTGSFGEKDANFACTPEIPEIDAKNMVFAMTQVTSGRAKAVVTATGKNTFFHRNVKVTQISWPEIDSSQIPQTKYTVPSTIARYSFLVILLIVMILSWAA